MSVISVSCPQETAQNPNRILQSMRNLQSISESFQKALAPHIESLEKALQQPQNDSEIQALTASLNANLHKILPRPTREDWEQWQALISQQM